MGAPFSRSLEVLRASAHDWRRGRFGLTFKIGLILILILLVLGSINVFFVSRQHRAVMVEDFSSKGYAVALSLANSAVETLLFYDASRIQSFIDSYRGLSGISYIFLMDSAGQVVAHTFVPVFPEGLAQQNRLAAGQKSSTRQLDAAGTGDVLDVAVPVLFGVIGEVHVGMDLGVVRTSVRSMVLSVIFQFGIALLLGIVVMYFAVHHLISPVGDLATAARRLGGGDLTVTAAGAGRRDEIGELARSFDAMVGYLREFVAGITGSRREMEAATRNLGTAAAEISGGVHAQQESINETAGRMEEMRSLSDAIGSSLTVLSQSAARTGASTGRIHLASGNIREGSRKLFGEIEKTGSTLTQLDAAIREVTRNVDALRGVAASTASSTLEMDASIREVEGRATEAAGITVDLEEQFKTGIESVSRAVASMDGIRESSTKVSSLIKNLTASMAAIENVLGLIGDINDQTGLLALNAAIIAAQAGEGGRGFSVVAGQMKALSGRTEKSAKEIAQMVTSIQREAGLTLSAVGAADSRVDESYELSRKAGDVILTIQRSVQEVSQRIGEIARATVEQARMGTAVSRAAQDLSASIDRMAAAADEQATSSGVLLRQSAAMRGIAESVDTAVDEQARESREIDLRMQEVNAAMADVGKATESQLAAIGSVREAIAVLNDISARNTGSTARLGEVMEALGERAASLRGEMRRFSTTEETDEPN